ncbi:MAG: hypothetical protein LBF41_10285 [Deltaproteobacteria bacterium]|jgi:4-amino-4-deoxychorismate lyase|nr:hypothetical protein [Deltaproteobacteria bacterium]
MTKPLFIEEIKVQNGRYHNLEGHAIRMDRTVRHFFRRPFHQPSLEKNLPKPPERGLHKCTVLYDDGIVSSTVEPHVISGVKTMGLVNFVPNVDFGYKTRNRDVLRAILDFSGTDEAIIVKDSFVTNATAANLVFEDEEGALWTPLHYVHSGTKREFYLKKKRIATYPVKVSNLRSFVRVILINAMTDLEDNVCVDCRDVGSLMDYDPKPVPPG